MRGAPDFSSIPVLYPLDDGKTQLIVTAKNVLCCCLVTKLYSSLFATPWTVACQTPLSMGFSRQEHLSGLPFPSPRDLPHPGIESASPAWQLDSLLTTESPGEPQNDLRQSQMSWGQNHPWLRTTGLRGPLLSGMAILSSVLYIQSSGKQGESLFLITSQGLCS